MNVGTGFIGRPPRRRGMVHDVTRLVDDIRRVGRIRHWRLLDHDEEGLQE